MATSASASSISCDHGYNTVKPDGTDIYREPMNLVMRTVLTMPQHFLSSDQLNENYLAIMVDLHTNFRNCWNEILLRKVIAAALNIIESYVGSSGVYSQHELQSHADAARGHRHFNQLNVLYPLVLHLEYGAGRGFVSPDETPTCPRDLGLFFIKRAPCHCFDEQKRRLEDSIRTDFCQYHACRKLDSYVQLKVCAKCSRQSYCSAECQRKDWPTHKEDCKMWRKMGFS